MVEQAPAPGHSPPSSEHTGLVDELRQDKAIYMAALKAAKTIGEETIKALPGGSILLGLFAGFESLAEAAENAELSDRVDRLLNIGDQTQDDIAALTGLAALLVSQQALLLERMQATGFAPEPCRLTAAAKAAALTAYRGRIEREYYYADYRGIAGITREEHAASLPFDQVYIQPRLLPERDSIPLQARERELLRQLADDDLPPEEKRRAEEEYGALTGQRWTGRKTETDDEYEVSIREALADNRRAVILGGPGAGKSVLTRYLARTCALGPEATKERLGWVDWPTPVLLPLAAFGDTRAAAIKRDDSPPSLRNYLDAHLQKIGGEVLRQAVAAELESGSALILLDGIDEVPEEAIRIAIVRAVEQFLGSYSAARCVITSRPYGYIRLKGELPHFQLANFSQKQVEAFVHSWQWCFERWRHPQAPNLAAAEDEAEAMIEEIRQHPKVAELATNPLMLVIIALIRVEDKHLPENRVELYNRAVNTLIDTWNRWRSQAEADVGGTQLPRQKLVEVWRAVALWTRREKPGSLVHRPELQQKLVELLEAKDLDEDHAEATAESYLNAAAARAGLLEERGANVFAFWHPSFEEFLAAMELATPTSKAAERLLPLRDDPRWREVILLAVGYIGLVMNDRDTVTEIVYAIAKEKPSPLEPLFHDHLRLAAACVADDVGVKRSVAEPVITMLSHVVRRQPYDILQKAFVTAARAMPRLHVKQEVFAGFASLATSSNWEMKVEAARYFSNLTQVSEEARHWCNAFIDNMHMGISAAEQYAALGLLKVGDYRPEVLELMGYQFSGFDASAERQLENLLQSASASVLPILHSMLNTDRIESKIAAARLLWLLGRSDEATMAPLLPALCEDEEYPHGEVWSLLRKMAGLDQRAVAVLRALRTGNDSRLRFEAATILESAGITDADEEVIEVLLSTLNEGEPGLWCKAAWWVMELGLDDEVESAARRALLADDPRRRVEGAQVLLDLDRADNFVVDTLLHALDEDDMEGWFDAARHLQRLGRIDKAAHIYRRLWNEAEFELRLFAAERMMEMGCEVEGLLEILIADVGGDEWRLPHWHVTKLLYELARADKDVREILLKLLTGENYRIRIRIAPVLWQLDYVQDAAEALADIIAPRSWLALAAYQKLDRRQPLTKEDGEALADLVTMRDEDTPEQREARAALFDFLWMANRHGVDEDSVH